MQAPAWPDQAFELLLFDPASFGEGCHQQHQPDHFLMNTAAEQLGWSAIRSEKHKSFAQWIREKGLDEASQHGMPSQHGTDDASSEYAASNSATPRTNSASHGYYARSLFGRYLRESLEQLLREAPDHIQWQWIQQKVTGLKKNTDGSWNLETPEELIEDVDFVHLCTGHGSAERPKSGQICPDKEPHQPSSFIEFIYPFDDHFASIASHQTVALEGMGLTAFDVVAELTEGRGGVFLSKGEEGLLEYIPSGREPNIIAYSRTGLPLKAKPKGQDQAHGKKVYKHLTDDVVRQLQSEAPVDFETQILPLVKLELKQTYYDTYFQLHPELWKNLAAAHEDATISANVADQKSRLALMESMVPQQDRFSLDALLDPFSSFDMQTEETFRRSLETYLREDFLKAELGVAGSPEKAAMNTLRDIREQIAKLIDFKMLRGDSQQWLYHTYLPKIKWLSVGPPRSRIAEWLALSEAGILTLNFGATPECIPAGTSAGIDRTHATFGTNGTALPTPTTPATTTPTPTSPTSPTSPTPTTPTPTSPTPTTPATAPTSSPASEPTQAPAQGSWIIRSTLWPSYARHADTLIRARIQVSDEIGNQPLVRNLFHQGLAKLFDNDGYQPGGLEVTRDFQVIGHNGKPVGNLWATGILTEGERFYTFSLPSPGKTSRFDADAKAAVQSMFKAFGNRTREAIEGSSKEAIEGPFKDPIEGPSNEPIEGPFKEPSKEPIDEQTEKIYNG